MGLQFSGTTWNSFSHRKRKVPGLACQSSFSPQNRRQLYLSTPWESAWSKDANLHLAGRKPGFYFSQLPAGAAHVTVSQLCVASPLQQRPGHAVMLLGTSSLKDQGQGRTPSEEAWRQPKGVTTTYGARIFGGGGKTRRRDRTQGLLPWCLSTTEQPSQELYLCYVTAAVSYPLSFLIH